MVMMASLLAQNRRRYVVLECTKYFDKLETRCEKQSYHLAVQQSMSCKAVRHSARAGGVR